MAANPTTTPVDHVHPTIATDDAPAVSGMWTAMSGRPYPFTSTTGALAKDVWKFVPCRLGAAATFAALTVETTVPASGGTAAMIFALYSVGTDGRPLALLTDLSSAGSVDLTVAAGVLQRSFTATQFPAGEFFIGCAWTGTATVSPTLRVSASSHPRIVDLAAGVVSRSGYQASVSGATAPTSPTVSTTATTGVVHFAKFA